MARFRYFHSHFSPTLIHILRNKLKNSSSDEKIQYILSFEEQAEIKREKRKILLLHCAELCEVTSAPWVLDYGRLGYIHLSKSNPEILGHLNKGNKKHMNDAIIAIAAIDHSCDFFVTQEDDLAKWVKREISNLKVLNYIEFIDLLDKL